MQPNHPAKVLDPDRPPRAGGNGARRRSADTKAPKVCAAPVFDAALLSRYDLHGPRYTSYPTAVQFRHDFTEKDYIDCAAATNTDPIPAPLSLYIHIPFCERPCFYCACTKIVTRNHGRAADYLRRVHAELARQADLFDPDRRLEQLHWGGGTPTFLSPPEMRALMEATRRHFDFAPEDECECSIEVDPRTVTGETVGFLHRLGFNRLSLGVQDFDPAVQAAVNRIQSECETLAVIAAARKHGYRSVSIDLIYGLPKQTVTSFAQTLERVVSAGPDRISVYSYAHLPAKFKAQRQIWEDELPSPAEKLQILQMIIERLSGAGYRHIGMDHFALESDDLYCAQLDGRLTRNFQGYSTHGECDLIGVGMSSISRVGDCYSQNARYLADYIKRVDEGRLPVARGVRLSEEDTLRRRIIHQLMCHFTLDYAAFEDRLKGGFWKNFSEEREALRAMEQDGLLEIGDTGMRVTPAGRLLVRNICMVFDAYLRRGPAPGTYSRTI